MHCIPVLDLMGGVVVRAVRGERAHYRPLVSTLTESSAPLAIAAALRARFDSRIFYLADLDAILGQGNNDAVVRHLVNTHQDCEWWLDAGFSEVATLARWASVRNLHCVLGSESLRSIAHYRALHSAQTDILSLDRQGEALLGPPALWQDPSNWPGTLIAMNLARVGAATGPDFDYLRELRLRAPDAHLVAAGGVRDLQDLARLQAEGVHAVLLASALHDGTVGAEEIKALAGIKGQGSGSATQDPAMPMEG